MKIELRENEVYDMRIIELYEKESKGFGYQAKEKPDKKEKYVP